MVLAEKHQLNTMQMEWNQKATQGQKVKLQLVGARRSRWSRWQDGRWSIEAMETVREVITWDQPWSHHYLIKTALKVMQVWGLIAPGEKTAGNLIPEVARWSKAHQLCLIRNCRLISVLPCKVSWLLMCFLFSSGREGGGSGWKPSGERRQGKQIMFMSALLCILLPKRNNHKKEEKANLRLWVLKCLLIWTSI